MEFVNARTFIGNLISSLSFSHYAISISHSDYKATVGGIEKVILNEERLFIERMVSYVHIYPAVPSIDGIDSLDPLIGVTVDSQSIGVISLPAFANILFLLKANNIATPLSCHIHHCLNLSLDAMDAFIETIDAKKVLFFIHDYYSICPQFNLLFNNSSFCGCPDLPSPICKACKLGTRRGKHYASMHSFLSKRISQFVAPSLLAKEIWLKAYPEFDKKVVVSSHLLCNERFSGIESSARIENDRIRIAYLGARANHKGWSAWQRLIHSIDRTQYELFHLGVSDYPSNGTTQVPVSFHDGGADSMVEKLIELRIDIVFLWSLCPETYSFTFFESLVAGSMVITNRLSGNIASQVAVYRNGLIFDSEKEMFAFFNNKAQVRRCLLEIQARRVRYETTSNPSIVESSIQFLTQSSMGENDRIAKIMEMETTRQYQEALKKIDMDILEGFRKLSFIARLSCLLPSKYIEKILQKVPLVKNMMRSLLGKK